MPGAAVCIPVSDNVFYQIAILTSKGKLRGCQRDSFRAAFFYAIYGNALP